MTIKSAWLSPVQSALRKQISGFCLIGLCIFMGVYSKIFIFVAFALCFFVLMTKSNEYFLELLFFLIPMAAAFKLSQDQSSLFSILMIPFILKALYRSKAYSGAIVGIFLMVAFLLSNTSYVNTSRCKDILLSLLLCYVVMTGKMELRFEKVITLFTIGVIISSAAALLAQNTPLFSGLSERITLMEVQGEDVSRFRGLYGNSNYYTLDITMLFACYMCIYCEKKSLLTRDWVLLMLLLVFGVLSGSFSFLITSAATILVALVYLSRVSVLVMVRSVIGFVGLLALVYVLMGSSARSLIMYRIESQLMGGDSLAEITTGRSDLQATYLTYISGSIRTILIGDGLAAPYLGSNGRGPHNTYIDMIYYLGLVGTILFVVSLIAFMRTNVRFSNAMFFQWFPVVCLLIRSFAISLLLLNNTTFYYLLIYLSFSFVTRKSQNHLKDLTIAMT